MYLITRGFVMLSIKKKNINEYFMLPEYTYFGDYWILLHQKSSECYTSDNKDITYTMCLKKKVLLDLMSNFPEASEYYMKRANQRRIEFKRVSLMIML